MLTILPLTISATLLAAAYWPDARTRCRLLHDAPMQPINGKYRCRVCLTEHPVWEEAK